MTDRTSGQHRTTAGMGDALRWLNTSGETIPAYGVIQLRANYTSGYNQASKPDDTQGLFFANGAVPVLSTKKGESLLWNRPRRVKVEGSPAVGTQVGPVADSWAMSEEGVGFYVMHQPVDGVATVVQVGAAGGGGGQRIWFTIDSVICADDGSMSLIVDPIKFTGGCTSSIPDADSYGQVAVVDICSTLLYYTAEWLVGKVGSATYFYPVGEEGSYCEGEWIVDTICGVPECS